MQIRVKELLFLWMEKKDIVRLSGSGFSGLGKIQSMLARGIGILLLQRVTVMWALAHTVSASKEYDLLSACPLVHRWVYEKQVVLWNSSQKTDFNCFSEVDKG